MKRYGHLLDRALYGMNPAEVDTYLTRHAKSQKRLWEDPVAILLLGGGAIRDFENGRHETNAD